MEVYPRVCGGTAVVRSNPARQPGLSPRMRGNPEQPHRLGRVRGSIPTYAGEPFRWPLAWCTSKVYPRVCGGTVARPSPTGYAAGLSPRMRGNLQPGNGHPHHSRSIPAYAGEPSCRRRPQTARAVYPRVCGGTTVWRVLHAGRHGLSPRMRGNPLDRIATAAEGGSIPAYAGEPAVPVPPIQAVTVYPRVCGGTDERVSDIACSDGLSPRMRGNRFRPVSALAAARSIPAYAGEPGAS